MKNDTIDPVFAPLVARVDDLVSWYRGMGDRGVTDTEMSAFGSELDGLRYDLGLMANGHAPAARVAGVKPSADDDHEGKGGARGAPLPRGLPPDAAVACRHDRGPDDRCKKCDAPMRKRKAQARIPGVG